MDNGLNYPHWKEKQLGDNFTFKNGINASREAFYSGGIPCIGVSDVYKCMPIEADNIIGTVNITEAELEKNKVCYGDILFQRSSETQEDIGHASVYIDKVPVVYNGFVICGKPDKLYYNPLFMHYELQNSRIRKQTISLGAGSQHFNIGQEGLAQIVVKYPCPAEQEKIANFLSSVDEVITQEEAEVSSLEQQKKAIIQKIFSRQIRFKSDDGSKFPEWEKKKLGELTRSIIEKNIEDNLPVYSVNNQRGFIPQAEQFEDREVASKDRSNYRIVSYHQFAYNPSRINVGSIAYLKENIKVIVSPLYVVFECLQPLNVDFLDAFIKTFEFKKQRKMNTAGSVRDSLSYEGFSDIFIQLPCLEEQQKIADFLSAFDEAIDYAKQELEKWKELKKGLLQQMFV